VLAQHRASTLSATAGPSRSPRWSPRAAVMNWRPRSRPMSSPALTLSRASAASGRVQLHLGFPSRACISTYNACSLLLKRQFARFPSLGACTSCIKIFVTSIVLFPASMPFGYMEEKLELLDADDKSASASRLSSRAAASRRGRGPRDGNVPRQGRSSGRWREPGEAGLPSVEVKDD
jgi:hypothetical protein